MHPHDGRVVSNFVMQALKGEDITIYGDGSQTRSFCYVDDLIEATVRTMRSPDDFTGPVNIGSGSGISVADVATTVAQIVGREDLLRLGELGDGDETRVVADVGRLAGELGFEPRYRLEEGLRDTVEWWRQRTRRR